MPTFSPPADVKVVGTRGRNPVGEVRDRGSEILVISYASKRTLIVCAWGRVAGNRPTLFSTLLQPPLRPQNPAKHQTSDLRIAPSDPVTPRHPKPSISKEPRPYTTGGLPPLYQPEAAPPSSPQLMLLPAQPALSTGIRLPEIRDFTRLWGARPLEAALSGGLK